MKEGRKEGRKERKGERKEGRKEGKEGSRSEDTATANRRATRLRHFGLAHFGLRITTHSDPFPIRRVDVAIGHTSSYLSTAAAPALAGSGAEQKRTTRDVSRPADICRCALSTPCGIVRRTVLLRYRILEGGPTAAVDKGWCVRRR